MKCISVKHPPSLDNLLLENREPAPEPGPGEIKVSIRAGSLNFRDSLVVNGFFPAPDGLIPLSDGAGDVIAIGSGVSEFAIGDRVVSIFHPKWLDGFLDKRDLDNSPGGPADGFACEEATRPATHFTRAPENLSYAEAATLTCAGVTAWRAVVTDGNVHPGEWVLVQGTGGVSLFALQFAKAAGAKVIATSSSTEKMDRLKALGADHVINYAENENWGDAVLDLTGGLGVEHIVEVGGPNTLKQSFHCARTGGHIAIIGAVGGFDVDAMPFVILQAKRLRVQAVTVGTRRDQIEMVRAIETHRIKPVVDKLFQLDDLAEAFRHLQSGSHVGKVCVEM
ncbi:zinc-dependent alcohol dehydrogenase family protein [Parasphingorhabdus sp.]|uniref:zinc-dependent alcohol dehydrogenase family protein n=1 Tax=Parasphingorhabdus sp. TaxID=2709688 RepID=UPI003A93723E